jgi:hypothetical protein
MAAPPPVADVRYTKMTTPPLHTVTLMDSSCQPFMFPVLPPQALQMTSITCPIQVHPPTQAVLMNNPMMHTNSLPSNHGNMSPQGRGNKMSHSGGGGTTNVGGGLEDRAAASATSSPSMISTSTHMDITNIMLSSPLTQAGSPQQQSMVSPFMGTPSPSSDLTSPRGLMSPPAQLSPLDIQMSPMVGSFMLSLENNSPTQSQNSSHQSNS